jgi:hypothetical protein
VVSMSSTQNLTSISGVSGVGSGIGSQCGRTDVRWQGEWVAGRRLGGGSVGTMTV